MKTILPSWYELGAILGKSLSTVYLVTDLKTKKNFALKHGYAALVEFEHKTLSQISHPGVVKVYELYKVDGETSSYVMELCAESVRDRATVARLTKEQVTQIESQLVAAVESFHRNGVNHGNICAENVLLRSTESVDLCLADPLSLRVFDPDRDYRQIDDLIIQLRNP